MVQSFNHSCILAAYNIFAISRNYGTFDGKIEKLKGFGESVLNLIRMIGITNNKKNDLNDKFNKFPL
jgi:hypothetical protein